MNVCTIRKHIKGVENTRQITRSMKMISTAKLRQNQAALLRLRSFEEKSSRAFERALSGMQPGENPYCREAGGAQKLCYVLFVGGRGLCGAYNTDILSYMEGLASKETNEFFTVVCGRWGRETIEGRGLNVRRFFGTLSDAPGLDESNEIAQYLKKLYLDGEADRIVLVYQDRKGLGCVPTQTVLLPVQTESGEGSADEIFEPDRDAIIAQLSEIYTDNLLRRVLLQAKSSEHFARMTAMTSATDNADELLKALTIEMNRTRQEQITTEIAEVSGGANALKRQKPESAEAEQ